MATESISYQKSGYFTKLIVDYLDEKPEVQAFYNRFPSIENFSPDVSGQIGEKQKNYKPENRTILVSALENQYRDFQVSEKTKTNISLLSDSKTFTVTTGHQLNLFTGPLYFLYKIVSTLNLCKELKEAYPEYHFVPVYWMATEDHDFEEINHFFFNNKKVKWDRESHGPAGRLSTDGLNEVYTAFATNLGLGNNADYLKKLFENAYLKHGDLAAATRYLANELFGSKGLVIIDGDDVSLKKAFVPYVKNELTQRLSFQKVTETNELLLDKNYEVQVNPREINLFYIEDTIRERILFENNQYKINNTSLNFSEEEIINLLETHPEKFSPNVVLRPLYQEVVLPNLCYIGGGGELAYWLQLKSIFEANNVSFPVLLLRNSVLFLSQKQADKAAKLNLSLEDLFSIQQDLFNEKTAEFSNFNIDFTKQKEYLKLQFETLKEIAAQTDKSFKGAVEAQEAKQLKGLENLEKRLLKAEKKVHAEKLERILQLQNEIFPGQSLQERKANFSEFYLEYGSTFIEKLFSELHPLKQEFTIITL